MENNSAPTPNEKIYKDLEDKVHVYEEEIRKLREVNEKLNAKDNKEKVSRLDEIVEVYYEQFDKLFNDMGKEKFEEFMADLVGLYDSDDEPENENTQK